MRIWIGAALVAALLTGSLVAGTSADAAASRAPTITRLSSYFAGPAGGGSVTITGTNLRKATKVTFGEAATTFTVVSADTIVAKVPAHAVGIVDVRVTVGTASSALVGTDQFIFHTQAPSAASVAIGSFVPSSGVDVCFGGNCHWIEVTTSSFSADAHCRVTNSDVGPFGAAWTQAATASFRPFSSYSGTLLEVTCDGVTVRRAAW